MTAPLPPGRPWPDGLGDEAIREQVTAWLDGELGPDEARALQRRLDEDPDALREVELLRRVDDLLLRDYPDEPVPEDLASRVIAAAGIRRREGPAAPVHDLTLRRRLLALGGVAAAACIALAIGLALRTGGEASDPVTPDAPADAVAVLESVPDEILMDAEAFDAFADLADEAIDAQLAGGFADLDLLAQGS